MNIKKDYSALDDFRLIAAILVITIHTSPLFSYSITADFVLTRIIARLAVPFFIMVSGFFIFKKFTDNEKNNFSVINNFTKKLSLIYLFSVILYLPLNIYSGYMQKLSLPIILRDFFLEGTFYHLWYLPATVIGIYIVYFIYRFLPVLPTVSILYLIGLFGDNYYKLVNDIPIIKNFYNAIFEVFTQTRNGLFLVPIFLVIGGMIAKHEDRKKSKSLNFILFLLFFSLMILEGLIINNLDIQRFDTQKLNTMYFMLVPTSYFLFSFLLECKGITDKKLRPVGLWVYIFHPWCIVIVRMAARFLNLTGVLVENGLVQFILVAISSFIAAIIFEWVIIKIKTKNLKRV